MKILTIFLALSVLVFLSCGGAGGGGIQSLNEMTPLQTETCCITTPVPNAELVSLLRAQQGGAALAWHIKWLTPEGKLETKRIDFAEAGQTVSIEFAKNRATPVLVYLTVNGKVNSRLREVMTFRFRFHSMTCIWNTQIQSRI